MIVLLDGLDDLMGINHFFIFVGLKYLKDLPTQLIGSVG